MIVIDSSAIIAALDARDRHHTAVRDWLESEERDLITTPLIIAEVDHVAGARGGRLAQQGFREDLVAGAYLVDWWANALSTSARVAGEYADSGIGMADASLVALAERIGTCDIATFDERHFRAIRPLEHGDSFRLIPLDL